MYENEIKTINTYIAKKKIREELIKDKEGSSPMSYEEYVKVLESNFNKRIEKLLS